MRTTVLELKCDETGARLETGVVADGENENHAYTHVSNMTLHANKPLDLPAHAVRSKSPYMVDLPTVKSNFALAMHNHFPFSDWRDLGLREPRRLTASSYIRGTYLCMNTYIYR